MLVTPFLVLFLSFVVPVGAVAFFGWLGLRYVRAREREALPRADAAAASELTRVAEMVEALHSEVAQLRERQDFVEKLLEAPRGERGESRRLPGEPGAPQQP